MPQDGTGEATGSAHYLLNDWFTQCPLSLSHSLLFPDFWVPSNLRNPLSLTENSKVSINWMAKQGTSLASTMKVILGAFRMLSILPLPQFFHTVYREWSKIMDFSHILKSVWTFNLYRNVKYWKNKQHSEYTFEKSVCYQCPSSVFHANLHFLKHFIVYGRGRTLGR